MPRLVRLYIRQVLVGFALSASFVALLLWQNVANLGHLVSTSDVGWLAVTMLFVFNGLVFAGVQFAISIMRLSYDDVLGGGGRTKCNAEPSALPIRIGPRL